MKKIFMYWMVMVTGAVMITMSIGGTMDIADAGEVYVFANKGVADQALSQAEVKNIYLGTKNRWSDNQRVVCVMLGASPCQDAFLREQVKKSAFQFNNYWKKQIFTGKGQPPKAFESEQALIDYVSQTSGAIGFSCSRPDTSKVSLISVN